MRLIGEGMANCEIAEEVSLAKRTVKNDVTVIYAKLQVEHRARVAVWA